MAGNDALVQTIVEIIKSRVNTKQALANLGKNQNLAPAITEIIKKSISGAPQVVAQAPPDVVVRAIVKAVQNGIQVSRPVANAAIEPVIQGGAPPIVTTKVIQQASPDVVVRAIVNALKRGIEVPKEVLNAAAKKNFRPKGSMTSNRPNFIAPTQTGLNNQGRPTYNQVPPFPGYVLTTRNKTTGWYRNAGPVAPSRPPPNQPRNYSTMSIRELLEAMRTGPVAPSRPPPNQPRNYSTMSIRELLEAMRKYPANREKISQALRKAFDKVLRDLRSEYSRSRRVRKLGDLLRLLPRNYNGRRNASSMVVNDVRETRNTRELSNVRSNLGSVPNENIRRAFENQRRRFEKRENEERRPPVATRRYGERNNNYELRRRRAVLENSARGGGYGGVSRPFRQTNNASGGVSRPFRQTNNTSGGVSRPFRQTKNASGGVSRPFRQTNNTGGGVSRPFTNNTNGGALPINQHRALTNVGGPNKAMNAIIKVPGGAGEVAKAAEALNETSGNVAQAITIKGASPEAVKAVQNLGGPTNTVNVLEGLNTLSRKTTPKKKTGSRRKTYRPRIAELNRVLEAVKKQRLISLVNHNVTGTRTNDEKLKKYYKKVLKANILRTPFAKIVRKSAKKNVSRRA